MTSIELVVTDLDGTLWEVPQRVPETTRSALAEVARRLPFLVATGRRVVSTREPLWALGLAPPAVMLNGALGLDLSTGDRFHRGGFSADEAAAVLQAFAEAELSPCVYVDDDRPTVRVTSTTSTHPDHLASFGDDVGLDDLDDVVANHHVLAFGILGLSPDRAVSMGDRLIGTASSHVSPDRQYGGSAITVAPYRRSKWDGIEAFCQARGIDPAAVLALGDGPNDVEMLESAAIALVPADADQVALDLADHIIPRADHGGWANLLDFL